MRSSLLFLRWHYRAPLLSLCSIVCNWLVIADAWATHRETIVRLKLPLSLDVLLLSIVAVNICFVASHLRPRLAVARFPTSIVQRHRPVLNHVLLLAALPFAQLTPLLIWWKTPRGANRDGGIGTSNDDNRRLNYASCYARAAFEDTCFFRWRPGANGFGYRHRGEDAAAAAVRRLFYQEALLSALPHAFFQLTFIARGVDAPRWWLWYAGIVVNTAVALSIVWHMYARFPRLLADWFAALVVVDVAVSLLSYSRGNGLFLAPWVFVYLTIFLGQVFLILVALIAAKSWTASKKNDAVLLLLIVVGVMILAPPLAPVVATLPLSSLVLLSHWKAPPADVEIFHVMAWCFVDSADPRLPNERDARLQHLLRFMIPLVPRSELHNAAMRNLYRVQCTGSVWFRIVRVKSSDPRSGPPQPPLQSRDWIRGFAHALLRKLTPQNVVPGPLLERAFVVWAYCVAIGLVATAVARLAVPLLLFTTYGWHRLLLPHQQALLWASVVGTAVVLLRLPAALRFLTFTSVIQGLCYDPLLPAHIGGVTFNDSGALMMASLYFKESRRMHLAAVPNAVLPRELVHEIASFLTPDDVRLGEVTSAEWVRWSLPGGPPSLPLE